MCITVRTMMLVSMVATLADHGGLIAFRESRNGHKHDHSLCAGAGALVVSLKSSSPFERLKVLATYSRSSNCSLPSLSSVPHGWHGIDMWTSHLNTAQQNSRGRLS